MTRSAFDFISHPEIPEKPRTRALTSILDKGLGVGQVEDLVASAGNWIDVVKLGWGTSRMFPRPILERKIQAYAAAGVCACTGGTLLEVAHAQGKENQLLAEAGALGFHLVEVSNGVHPMAESEKLRLIERAREAGFRVWSEVGKKDPQEDARLTLGERVRAIQAELEAGSEKVILEARESGTVGIYDENGKPLTELLHRLTEKFGTESLIFEAPRKSQQVWLIQTFGTDVNLANIAPEDAISVGTLRFGLRGDTFADIHLKGAHVYVEVGVTGAVEARRRGGVVVVVDALRASATIITALAMGMKSVRPVATVEECVGDVTAGERGGFKLPNVDHGNSPTELLNQNYRGRELTLTTTNCIECVLTAAGPNSVILIGSSLNASAVAREAHRLALESNLPLTLLLAGRGNREAIEDSLAAGQIFHSMPEARLHGEPLPTAAGLEPAFFGGDSGRNLVALGYADDVRFCAQADLYSVVPILRNGIFVPLEMNS
ncbi:MAG: phosphosulfolactate synthase [Thermoanaerobaculia bacterium]